MQKKMIFNTRMMVISRKMSTFAHYFLINNRLKHD